MDATALFWSRLQFAITNMMHYVFPPLSIGLGLFLVIVGALYLKTRNPVFDQVSRFWTKVFGITFTIGVATGIPMEFQFGTNWAAFSRYVGDVFGSALAAEGIFAFFLESGFLAIVLFGAGRVSPAFHYFGTVMVCLGAHFSAVWIVVADSWMQTPTGYHVVMGPNGPRAEITDFWGMVFNPSSVTRLSHVVLGAWLSGAFLVLSVSAWYLLGKKHTAFARAGMSVALPIAAVVSLAQLFWSGHESAELVAKHQPSKLAAIEGHWGRSAPADMTLVGWIDEAAGATRGIKLPGMTSWLVHGDTAAPIQGLEAIPKDERPPLQISFQAYHAMIAIGVGLIGLSLLGSLLAWQGGLQERRLVLWLFVLSVLGPMAANELGWITAEVGRQPWIVYGLMKTRDGVSPTLSGAQVVRSTGLFLLIYGLLFAVFVYVLNDIIQHGPDALGQEGPIVPLPEPLKAVLGQARGEA